MSATEKRYAKKSELKEKVLSLIWPQVVKESKLYVEVQSPFS